MMFNKLVMYWGHLKNSKKSILISTLGLIFAIAIFSSMILFINTEKVDIINDILKSTNQSPYEIEIDVKTQDLNLSFDEIHSEIKTLGDYIINITQINFMNNLELFYSIQGVTLPKLLPQFNVFNNSWQPVATNRSLILVQLTDGIKKDLAPFINDHSSLPPQSTSDQIQGFLLDPYFGSSSSQFLQQLDKNNYDNYANNIPVNMYQTYNNFTVVVPIYVTGHAKIVNYDVYSNVQNRFVPNYNESSFPTLSKVFKVVNPSVNSSYLFVNNLTQILSDFQPLAFEPLTHKVFYGISACINGGYQVNYDKFDPFTIGGKIDQIKSLSTIIRDKIFQTDFYKKLDKSITVMNIKFIDYSRLNDILGLILGIIYEMLLYAVPMFIIALLITNYSFGLIQKNILSLIRIYKTRGSTPFTLFTFQLLDYCIIVIISAIIGMIVGVPIVDVVTKTDGLLNFNNQERYDVLTNFMTILPYLFVILFILSIVVGFIVNIRKMIKISKSSVEEKIDVLESDEPYWKRHYFDLGIFFYGVISYLIINFYLFNPSTYALIIPINIFILVLFIPGPFAIVIGTILISNRLIPTIMNFIGKRLWERSGGLFAFSFKGVTRHKQSATRAIILIACLVTFLILFYTIPSSQLNYENISSQYDLGAQAQVSYDYSFVQTGLNSQKIIAQMILIQNNYGVNLSGITPVLSLEYYSSSANQEFTILFINSSTYYDGSSVSQFNLGLSKPLSQDLNQLNPSSMKNGIIVSSNFLNTRNVKTGQNTSLEILGSYQQVNVLDGYNEWPMTSIDQYNSGLEYFIMDLSYFFNIVEPLLVSTQTFHILSFSILLNFKDITGMHDISIGISNLTKQQVNEAKLNLAWWDQASQLVFKFRLGQINIDVLMSLFIAVTILLMFAYMQLIERRQEIYTERALGMKLSQIAFTLYIESIILLFCGLLLGTLISVYFINTLAIFITGGITIPRYEVLLPLDLVLWTYFFLILFASICSILPAYYLSRQDIVRTFTVEY